MFCFHQVLQTKLQRIIDTILELEVGKPGMACALVISFYMVLVDIMYYQPEIELHVAVALKKTIATVVGYHLNLNFTNYVN